MRCIPRVLVLTVAVGFALGAVTPVRADDMAGEAAKADSDVWVADFDQAVAKARAEKKDLFVDFTGSDWCGWCIKLHKEVFVQDAFLEAAKKDYVLVALDFPKADELKAKVPNQARNKELAKKYGVRGYPTILLMTADGEVYGQTGYQQGGAENYVEHVKSLRETGLVDLKSAKELSAQIAAAKTPEERSALADQAIAAFEALADDAPTVVRSGPVKAAFASDPQNKSGIAAKAAKALIARGEADDALLAKLETLDPKNEHGLLERAVFAKGQRLGSLEDVKAFVASVDALHAAGTIKDEKIAKDLAVAAMFMNHQHLKNPAAARVYAEKAKALGVSDNPRIVKMIDEILASDAAAPAPEKK